MAAIADHAVEIRWLTVCGVLLCILLWEQQAPLRASTAATIRGRWPTHFAFMVANNALLAVLAELAPFAMPSLGLLDAAGLPLWLAAVLTVVVLDLMRYLMHVAQHNVPLLWRIHRVHHADVEYDFSTSFRFHPLDALLAASVSVLGYGLLGVPPVVLLAAELLRQVSDAVGHANVRIPEPVDRVMRAVVVTPNVHRVHHSVHRAETDSNYGSLFTWWDRLFGTYRARPADGHADMRIGLDEFRAPAEQRFLPLLLLPFGRR